jgi:hypothetical protein
VAARLDRLALAGELAICAVTLGTDRRRGFDRVAAVTGQACGRVVPWGTANA